MCGFCFWRFSYSDYAEIWVVLGFLSVFSQYLFFYLKSNGPDETFFDANFMWITCSINMGFFIKIISWFCMWIQEGFLRKLQSAFLFIVVIFAVIQGYAMFNTVK